ncbi:hypothetical protein FQN53_008357 [Emmonsiellopsis sp. PD_33]|nr:hypothetical protein FQN53_008357 [Emmonsiellopsis sp. PD_33]
MATPIPCVEGLISRPVKSTTKWSKSTVILRSMDNNPTQAEKEDAKLIKALKAYDKYRTTYQPKFTGLVYYVSLTDENHMNCTTIVPGMHHHTEEWNARLREKGFSNGGKVQDVGPPMLTDEDLSDFQTRWTTVPCKAGDARITMPHIPHVISLNCDGANAPVQHRMG